MLCMLYQVYGFTRVVTLTVLVVGLVCTVILELATALITYQFGPQRHRDKETNGDLTEREKERDRKRERERVRERQRERQRERERERQKERERERKRETERERERE